MIGWIGLILLCTAYLFIGKKKSVFLAIDTVASLLLVLHAGLIGDIVFAIVNGYIAIICAIEFRRELNDKS